MQRTTNYGLCQYEGSDKTSYLVNYNDDMLKIDTAIKGAADSGTSAQTTADRAEGKADTNTENISALNTQINGTGGIATDLATVQGTVQTVTSLIGNGEPTTTDKTLIGAINELNAEINGAGGIETKIGNLTSLTTTDKDNLVAAINELNADKQDALSQYVLIDQITLTAEHDGVKTHKELLGELFGLWNGVVTGLAADEYVSPVYVKDNYTFTPTVIGDIGREAYSIPGSFVQTISNAVYSHSVFVHPSSAYIAECDLTTNTYTDYSANVGTHDCIMKVNKYKKITVQ